MAQYGVSISVDENKGYLNHYSFVVDTTAQVRELLINTTAPIKEVLVTEEIYGQEARMLTAEEILGITLDHPLKTEALSLA